VIAKVVQDGQLLFQHKALDGAKKVLDPRVAFIMSQIMSDDSNRKLIFGMGSILTLAASCARADQIPPPWPRLAARGPVARLDGATQGCGSRNGDLEPARYRAPD
jgi:hypothetical protein